MKAAKTIIIFLTQRFARSYRSPFRYNVTSCRSGRSKSTKDSNEAEYRAIFDSLISDLLTVLFWPEWPAASLLLSLACKYMVCQKKLTLILADPAQVASMDDVKTTNANENNAAKTMALDHLGLIASRLRSTALKFADGDSRLLSMDEVIAI